ncbi:MYND finger [Chlorella sorokiniana]|uniref:MYND finger n=1 Tax=Chlorella sorokiniana TaxID=3076 RepID=A0A2P6TLC4_CHLSO|nr:MYND finger [Chlorella sorokiniana]|eukprot:PRW45100.1 MYND finger [Chlorella sorokiniana]
MSPKPRGSSRNAPASPDGDAATATAAAAPTAGSPAAAEPPPAPQPETFADEKLQWALAVPPEQRQPSMQLVINNCQCTTEATRLLSAAPLAQLGGPAKLRALLLLLKAYWSLGGQSPLVPGICLQSKQAVGRMSELARQNLKDLLWEEPLGIHPELQPLYFVAASAAYLVHQADVRTTYCSSVAISNSSSAAVARSTSCGRVAGVRQEVASLKLGKLAGIVNSLLHNMKDDSYCGLLQQQLDGMGGGLLTARGLQRMMHETLCLVHTWAATPDGAYCGGQVDQQHVAAGRAAFAAVLELSNSGACAAGTLVAFSNLLRRTGAAAESVAVLRRALAAARAAGDALQELNAAAALAAAISSEDGWRYGEVAALVQAMQRCLQDCKPWLPGPPWRAYEQKVRYAEKVLALVRGHYPNTYASRLLPGCQSTPTPNTFVPSKAAKKIGVCSGCGSKSSELKFCARCQEAKYCSRACQAAHWKAGHKAECVPRAGQRAS